MFICLLMYYVLPNLPWKLQTTSNVYMEIGLAHYTNEKYFFKGWIYSRQIMIIYCYRKNVYSLSATFHVQSKSYDMK